jgi:hypothetical protein
MSKHIKVNLARPEPAPKYLNFKRSQRRKALKAKIKAKSEYMMGWADRLPAQVQA